MKNLTIIALGLILLATPAALAQTINFGQLVVTEDVSPEERFAKKVELTADALKGASERVAEMHEKLEDVQLEEETPQRELRDKLIVRTEEYGLFYEEQTAKLKEAKTIEEVDALIDGIIVYRENIYSPGAREILEFILVYSYTPSVLDLASQRLDNIRQDVGKLEGLGLVEPDSFTTSLNEADGILQEAKDLQSQGTALLMENYAQSLLEPTATALLPSTSDPAPTADLDTQTLITPKGLAEQSLTKIKTLYQLFMETGDRVNQSLGIGS
ncbi:MAG: hypothetical protein Q8P99_03065 [bacterium]|nr:hypothetical protein [bacterium]MDZ4231331.1 hypothetical protein [Patescibacteria group bacterium]